MPFFNNMNNVVLTFGLDISKNSKTKLFSVSIIAIDLGLNANISIFFIVCPKQNSKFLASKIISIILPLSCFVCA